MSTNQIYNPLPLIMISDALFHSITTLWLRKSSKKNLFLFFFSCKRCSTRFGVGNVGPPRNYYMQLGDNFSSQAITFLLLMGLSQISIAHILFQYGRDKILSSFSGLTPDMRNQLIIDVIIPILRFSQSESPNRSESCQSLNIHVTRFLSQKLGLESKLHTFCFKAGLPFALLQNVDEAKTLQMGILCILKISRHR